ncbi:MAG: isoprenyl transferase [Gammaproteobacteria bacterium]|nr:isoprenyl transferase [Gammaproteobacteria bacterium]
MSEAKLFQDDPGVATGRGRIVRAWHQWTLRGVAMLTRPLYWWYERRLLTQVQSAPLPHHLGLILDGNRRFARKLGLDASLGHALGVEKVREMLEWCLDLGVPTVTLWVFSTDNFKREPREVGYLAELFVREARRLAEDPRTHAHRVRVRAIGRLDQFPDAVRRAFADLEASTAHYDGMLLQIAVGYGGREEIVDAVRTLLRRAAREGRDINQLAEALGADDISRYLYAAGTPDPDFIIRTSGEVRLSGFLLWQAAYSEYYFTDVLWPGLRKIDFLRALRSYQDRERRWGR